MTQDAGPSEVREALDNAIDRLRTLLPELGRKLPQGLLPHVTEAGCWQWVPFKQTGRWDGGTWSHGYWTGGFVAGWLWQAAQCAANPEPFLQSARSISRALAVRAKDRVTHDIGFLFWPSAVLGAVAEADAGLADTALTAARTLMARAHPSGLIQAWGDLDDARARGSSTIDTMMNLPLLWWAANHGIPKARDTAVAHARRSAAIYIRDDGTTFHTARIDDDGAPVMRGTYQGYAENSCWSRGQAWAVHGFVDAYRATSEAMFKDTAERLIDTFLERLPTDGIAPWDFGDPEWRQAPRDASATAIVAAALLKLGLYEGQAGERWSEEGRRLTSLLVAHAFNSGIDDGLLLRSTYSRPHGSGVSGAVTWGDYFLLESLLLTDMPSRCLDPILQ